MSSFRISLIAVCFATTVLAADWPQWLGPKRDGSTSESVEPWKGELKPIWSAEVGLGFSSPVVSSGRVYVHARVSDKNREEMTAFDAKTGKELWRTGYERSPYNSVLNTGPQATPVVAGGKVYAYGITGMLSCFDAESGSLVWQVDALKQFKQSAPRFGVCCSPVVVGNRVIVAVGGQGSAVVAFDTKAGEVAWESLDEAANTSSPLVIATKGQPVPDVVFMTRLRVVGLNPLDGSVNWEYSLPFQPSGTAPTPILAGDTLFTSTMDNGTTGIKLKADDEVTPERLWQSKDLSGYFSTGVAAKDRLFLVTNVLNPIPRADLVCVELNTGKEVWKKEAVGYFHFGMIRTGNGKLIVLSDEGTLKLLDAEADEYRELCSAKVCEGTLVTPTFADGYLYVRDAEKVVCLQLVP